MKNRIKTGPRAGLQVEIEGGKGGVGTSQLVIRIGIETLRVSAECSDLFLDDTTLSSRLRVTEPLQFACEVARELEREEEDGTTLIHLMFDKAFERAVEQGAEGVELIEPTDPVAFMKRYMQDHPNAPLPVINRAYVERERRRAKRQAEREGRG